MFEQLNRNFFNKTTRNTTLRTGPVRMHANNMCVDPSMHVLVMCI